MKYELHDYQKEAITFALNNPKCLIWGNAGTGKTLLTLHLLSKFKRGNVLIVAPFAVIKKETWQKEIIKWGIELRVDVDFINYESIHKLTKNYDLIIYDEVHRIKSRTTATAKGGSIRAFNCKKLSRKAKRVIGLSGTLEGNSIEDIYWTSINCDVPIPSFTTNTILSTKDCDNQFDMFVYRYCDFDTIPTEHGYIRSNMTIKPMCKDEVDQILKQKIFRITKTYPYKDIQIKFKAPKHEIVKNLEKSLTIDGEDNINILVKCQKLQQSANGFVYNEEIDEEFNKTIYPIRFDNHKQRIIKNLFRDTINNEPTILVYKFQEDRNSLLEVARDQDIVLSIAQSEGVNYQEMGFSNIVFLSPDFSNIKMTQMIARIARQGQQKEACIYTIIRQGSIDEAILKSLERKGKLKDVVSNYLEDSNGK